MSSPKQGRRTVLIVAGAGAILTALGCSDDETTNPTGGGGGTGNNGGDGGVGGVGGSGNNGGMGGDGGSTGGMGGQGGNAATCTMGAEATDITNNHANPHALMTIPTADIEAGTEMTYTLEPGSGGGGGGGHQHDITITAADFAELAAGNSITVTSTPVGGEPHTHVVTISCA